jgi:hypothetical protein
MTQLGGGDIGDIAMEALCMSIQSEVACHFGDGFIGRSQPHLILVFLFLLFLFFLLFLSSSTNANSNTTVRVCGVTSRDTRYHAIKVRAQLRKGFSVPPPVKTPRFFGLKR